MSVAWSCFVSRIFFLTSLHVLAELIPLHFSTAKRIRKRVGQKHLKRRRSRNICLTPLDKEKIQIPSLKIKTPLALLPACLPACLCSAFCMFVLAAEKRIVTRVAELGPLSVSLLHTHANTHQASTRWSALHCKRCIF